jgi:hypothetical protein
MRLEEQAGIHAGNAILKNLKIVGSSTKAFENGFSQIDFKGACKDNKMGYYHESSRIKRWQRH